MKIRHIATRFAIVLAIAAMLPLVAYGLLVAAHAAARHARFGRHGQPQRRDARRRGNSPLHRRRRRNPEGAGRGPAEHRLDSSGSRIASSRTTSLQFREFRELTLFDESGQVIATSRTATPRVAIPSTLPPAVDGVAMSPIRVDEDLLPTTTFAIHLTRLNQPSGWLVGEFSLEQMWRMVDEIRIGEHGYALVVAPDGALVAHGNPDKKALVAQSRNLNTHPLVRGVAQAVRGWSIATRTAGSNWASPRGSTHSTGR